MDLRQSYKGVVEDHVIAVAFFPLKLEIDSFKLWGHFTVRSL